MNRLEEFMARLKGGLAKLPKETADDVIAYYSEYIEDAKAAGLSEDTILSKMGSVEHILSAVVDEMVIAKAQKRPGPVNLMKSSKRMLGRGASRAAKSTSLAMLSILPLMAALIFYIASAAFVLAAPASTAFLVYSIVSHTGLSGTDIWAQVGLILTLFALCAAIAWGLWKAANGLTRVTLGIFRRIAAKAKAIAVNEMKAAAEIRPLPRKKKWRELVSGIVLIVLLATGINLSFLNDLIPRYWSLWNSQKPADITMVKKDFPADGISKLKITMLNTRVEIVAGTEDTIQIEYEQAPYFSFDAAMEAGILEVSETGNGKLPMIDVLSKHEGMTTLVVRMPKNSSAIELEITTNGGHVDIDAPFKGYEVYTNDGNITLHSANGEYNGTLHSNGGKVTVVEN